jgi:TolB-like protein/DNA-binding winged helix-turn-helix (wHTH) protein
LLYCAHGVRSKNNKRSRVNDMRGPATFPMRVGAWRVDPLLNEIADGTRTVRIEARTMRLLLCLAARPGEVVSVEELLDLVWAGVVVTPDSVYQAVAALRRHLADDPKTPTYIATVPRLGYRMVAAVAPWRDEPLAPSPSSPPSSPPASPPPAASGATAGARRGPRRPRLAATVGCLAAVLAIGAAYLLHARTPAAAPGAPTAVPRRSVAVLPFLDLTTEAMNEEVFADGLTEELIGDLSRLPDLQVPPPTSSFLYKDRKLAVADIARQLGVAYVLDGSVRKSGTAYRVGVRLVRAANGYVVFAAAYERPLGDLLTVQKAIAAEATDGIRRALEAAPAPAA